MAAVRLLMRFILAAVDAILASSVAFTGASFCRMSLSSTTSGRLARDAREGSLRGPVRFPHQAKRGTVVQSTGGRSMADDDARGNNALKRPLGAEVRLDFWHLHWLSGGRSTASSEL